MTKTLSEQLCEIVGLEAETIVVDCPARTSGIQLKEVFVDFEQPENFVKLLNILWENKFDMNVDGGSPDYEDLEYLREKSYAKSVLKFLIRYYEDCHSFTQSIRYYDGWVWG